MNYSDITVGIVSFKSEKVIFRCLKSIKKPLARAMFIEDEAQVEDVLKGIINVEDIVELKLKDAIDEKKIYAVTKFGTRIYSEIKYEKDIFLLFGSETTGLPKVILSKLKNHSIKIPMINESRSLNLSNSVAIVVYEVWRQLKFSSINL